MVRTIQVVQHDPAWKIAYAREAALLSDVFANSLRSIHHVGSTSLSGVPAKPIIDILVVLADTASIARFSPTMEQLGYLVRGECLDAEIPGTPGRFYFSKDTGGLRTHQVHACAIGHFQIDDMLTLRDYLREHPDRAAAYGALKQSLAPMHRHDTVGYMRGKDAFVKLLLTDAREWARRTE